MLDWFATTLSSYPEPAIFLAPGRGVRSVARGYRHAFAASKRAPKS